MYFFYVPTRGYRMLMVTAHNNTTQSTFSSLGEVFPYQYKKLLEILFLLLIDWQYKNPLWPWAVDAVGYHPLPIDSKPTSWRVLPGCHHLWSSQLRSNNPALPTSSLWPGRRPAPWCFAGDPPARSPALPIGEGTVQCWAASGQKQAQTRQEMDSPTLGTRRYLGTGEEQQGAFPPLDSTGSAGAQGHAL